MKSKLLIVIIAAATLMSCSTTKDNKLPYFMDLRNQQHGTLPNPENEYVVLVQPDDELVITVSSVSGSVSCPGASSGFRSALQTRTPTFFPSTSI